MCASGVMQKQEKGGIIIVIIWLDCTGVKG